MDDLLKNRARAVEDAKSQKRRNKLKKTVTYAIDGKAVKEKLTKKKKAGLITATVIGWIMKRISINVGLWAF